MANKIVTILEITETHIKLAQAKEELQGNVITKFIIENISSNIDEDISKRLNDLIKKFNIKPINLITVIPRNQVTLRNVSLPSEDPAEISKMVKLQATRQIPYSREDIVIDHLIIGKDISGYSKVLLVIVHKDVINRYLKIINATPVKPGLFTLSSQGLCNWHKAYQDITKEDEQKTIMLIDIDTVNTEICFFSNKQLIFSRSVSFGIRDLDSGNFEDFLRQIHLTLSTYTKEKAGQDISKIVLAPASEHIKNFAQRFEAEFLVPIEVIEPQVILPKEERLTLPNQVVQAEVSSSVILGLTLSKKDELIDLMPWEIQQEQERQAKKKEFMSLGILLALTIVFILLGVFTTMYRKEQRIKTLETSLKQTSPEAEEVARVIKKLDLIKQRLNPKMSSIDILYELYNLLPENMSLSIFGLDDQGNLSLQGVAVAMSDVFSFQSNLDKSAYFSNVEVKYASKRRTRQGEVTDFRITCQITK